MLTNKQVVTFKPTEMSCIIFFTYFGAMVYKHFADKIQSQLNELRLSDVKIVICMALRAQYADGRIHIDRKTLSKYTRLSMPSIHYGIANLQKEGLIDRIEGKRGTRRNWYKVNLSFPMGKHGINLPDKKLFKDE